MLRRTAAGLATVGLAGLSALQAAAWGLPWVAAAPLGLALAVPMLLARAAPVPAALLLAAGVAAATLSGHGQGRLGWPWPAAGCVAALVALHRLAVHRGWPLAGPALVLLAAALAPAAWTVPLPVGLVLLAIGACALAVSAGDNIRSRRAAQERRRAEAVRAERARIARELHDVVAHHLSLIAIEAQAAPHRGPDAAPAAFAQLHTLARDGLTEMRAVLRLLRDADAGVRPQPTLADVPALVERVRRAGGTVSAELPAVTAAAGVQLVGYRIIQEALSNAARHAPGAEIAVAVARDGGELRVRVTNGPPPGSPPPSPGAGLGLIGMRERAQALGGRLEAGPDGGGFRVEAWLP